MSFTKIVLIPTGLIAVGVLVAAAAGVRLNVTPSVPVGLYYQTPAPQHPKRGSLVVVCLDPSEPQVAAAIARGYLPVGNCPGGVAPLLKPVAGVPGDRIVADTHGVRVNGVLQPGSAPLSQDPQGHPLQLSPTDYVVQPDQVLLLTKQPLSFDGRYLGPVDAHSIQAEARPLLLF
ncbi:conjugative transfer signal peptidase TraF [Stenotrophomonas sepilia]|uniref:Conjugative transfer signal peptidase TraF n=1 Tax=Stenotrophomonas sepilia TaxID=2860290 RepID=A0ABQ6QGS9_9GAMM|nr:conjugative transfer signal peptidase TraF [Stenotrophomonas sepilia]